jgi:hypothetical protein
MGLQRPRWRRDQRLCRRGRGPVARSYSCRAGLVRCFLADGCPAACRCVEVLVGIALILGLLTGIAAFFGIVMNLNYLLAGAASTNPILGFLALFLILAWRVAGYYGLDRYVLPLLGTPWTGRLTGKQMFYEPTCSQSGGPGNVKPHLPI